MRVLIIICLCAMTGLASPQGYNYNLQQNGFPIGIPNFNTNSQIDSTSSTHENQGFAQQTGDQGNTQQAMLSTLNHRPELSAVPNYFNMHTSPQQNFAFQGVQQQQQLQGSPITNFAGQQQQFNGFQQQHQQQQPANYPLPSAVTKDIYVHVAPEDGHAQQYRQPAQPPAPPRKHYRIVFIKAPSQNINSAALRVQQAPTEEKTIIYVLTKKADPLDLQAAIQQIQPKQPSKPEVYFIKYKTQEEAQHAQRAIQAQYEQLGGTSQVSDEGVAPVTSVIGSLSGGGQKPAVEFSIGSGHSTSSSATSSSTTKTNFNNANKYLPPIVKF